MATQPNREIARDGLTTLLTARLVTTDTIVQEVNNYRKGDFGGQFTVVNVSSAGAFREAITVPQPGVRQTFFYLYVDVFVLYAADGWTEAQAQDRQDLVEATIADVVDLNSGLTAYWNAADYEGTSEIEDVKFGGVPYLWERIKIGVDGFYG